MLKTGKWIWASTITNQSYFLNKRGNTVEILRPLTYEEADLDETGPMYYCKFQDGTEITAFDDELIGGPIE